MVLLYGNFSNLYFTMSFLRWTLKTPALELDILLILHLLSSFWKNVKISHYLSCHYFSSIFWQGKEVVEKVLFSLSCKFSNISRVCKLSSFFSFFLISLFLPSFPSSFFLSSFPFILSKYFNLCLLFVLNTLFFF